MFQATKNPFYLHVGRDILQSLNNHTKTHCGYATVHDVYDKSLEDRQESFFLSETCKYLILLFDVDNPINRFGEKYLFTTEGHVFPIKEKFQRKVSIVVINLWQSIICHVRVTRRKLKTVPQF